MRLPSPISETACLCSSVRCAPSEEFGLLNYTLGSLPTGEGRLPRVGRFCFYFKKEWSEEDLRRKRPFLFLFYIFIWFCLMGWGFHGWKENTFHSRKSSILVSMVEKSLSLSLADSCPFCDSMLMQAYNIITSSLT